MANHFRTGAKRMEVTETLRLGAEAHKLVAIDLNDQSVVSGYVDVQQHSRHAMSGSRELNSSDAWTLGVRG